MKITFFHWGLHAWAIYAVVALTLAFFCYRHGLPLTLRSALYPLIGNRIHGPIGHAVDIFAIIGTVLGVATSLGLGVAQINSGLNHLFGVPVGVTTQIILIIVTCGLATLSWPAGWTRASASCPRPTWCWRRCCCCSCWWPAPPCSCSRPSCRTPALTCRTSSTRPSTCMPTSRPTGSAAGLFYWGWWIAWSPFVGLFIARISRGRTIREFVSGVLLVPAGFTLFWMTVFGDTAIHFILVDGIKGFAETVQGDSSLALFAFLEQLPWSGVVSIVAIAMVAVFFVTSADSGALVVDLLASGGAERTPMLQRIFWSLLMGAGHRAAAGRRPDRLADRHHRPSWRSPWWRCSSSPRPTRARWWWTCWPRAALSARPCCSGSSGRC